MVGKLFAHQYLRYTVHRGAAGCEGAQAAQARRVLDRRMEQRFQRPQDRKLLALADLDAERVAQILQAVASPRGRGWRRARQLVRDSGCAPIATKHSVVHGPSKSLRSVSGWVGMIIRLDNGLGLSMQR